MRIWRIRRMGVEQAVQRWNASFWERLLRSAIFLGTEDGFSGVCYGCFLKLRFVCEVKIVEIVWLREGNSTLREKTTDSTKNYVV